MVRETRNKANREIGYFLVFGHYEVASISADTD